MASTYLKELTKASTLVSILWLVLRLYLKANTGYDRLVLLAMTSGFSLLLLPNCWSFATYQRKVQFAYQNMFSSLNAYQVSESYESPTKYLSCSRSRI